MFKNSVGGETLFEETIFPLISFNPETKIWKCVGTGFFIYGLGWFVTARHVFVDGKGKTLPTLYGIQTTATKERHIRPVTKIVTHKDADICIGLLGKSRLENGSSVKPQIATSFTLNLKKLNNQDSVRTYAFPKSEVEELRKGEFLFRFQGKWSAGQIVDFQENGSPLVRNRCYQTSMFIR